MKEKVEKLIDTQKVSSLVLAPCPLSIPPLYFKINNFKTVYISDLYVNG